jgi:serine/threonine protein kinase
MEQPHGGRMSQVYQFNTHTANGFLEYPIFGIGLKIIDSSRDLRGTVIDNRYILEDELGRGGIGSIFLARDSQLHGRPVVVKILSPALMQDWYIVKKFRQESEALSRFNHPGVVSVFGAGTLDDGTPFIVMQYVNGPTLRSQITPAGMDFKRTASILRQLGVALDEVHDNGIIHRDLKPENIMLQTLNDGSELVKIIDFGIAKVTDSLFEPVISRRGTIGTLRYLSPEQIREETLTITSDIYSLGVVAFEMLTGERPFAACSRAELLQLQQQSAQLDPVASRSQITPKAQAILLRALSFDPSARYQHASDFGQELADELRRRND